MHLYWRRAMSLAALLSPRSEPQRALGELARTVSRTRSSRLAEEPDGLRAKAAAAIARAATLPDPERRAALAEAKLVAQYPEPYGLGVDPVGQVVIAQEFDLSGLA